MSDYTEHYNHLQIIHRKLLDHSWCRQQTRYDSEFIAWLAREIMAVSNEAYSLTQGRGYGGEYAGEYAGMSNNEIFGHPG